MRQDSRRRRYRKRKNKSPLVIAAAVLVLALCAVRPELIREIENRTQSTGYTNIDVSELDIRDGGKEFEIYSPLDALGRCGTAYANLSQETMPTKEREEIGMIKPSGWHTVKYSCVEGKYLYNRCHLIGYQLAGENANPENLITGTRYMNTEGMLPYENLVADYIRTTGNHVLYRVTPEFTGSELVARSVKIEALSVEDDGAGIRFSVEIPNTQPGIVIDYATGESRKE